MTGGGPEHDGAPVTGINVTPMVDVVLVLLIIFMATAPLLQRRVLNVSVPKSSQGERKATQTLQLFYTADRQVMLGSEAVSPEALSAALADRLKLEPSLHVSLAADKALPYGEVVALLDVVRKAGVKKVALDVTAAR